MLNEEGQRHRVGAALKLIRELRIEVSKGRELSKDTKIIGLNAVVIPSSTTSQACMYECNTNITEAVKGQTADSGVYITRTVEVYKDSGGLQGQWGSTRTVGVYKDSGGLQGQWGSTRTVTLTHM